MLENLFRDEVAVPMVAERFAAFRGYFDAAQDALLSGRELRGAPSGAHELRSDTRAPSRRGSR